jgi:hypothetical protein
MTVWKYPLCRVDSVIAVSMPVDAQVLAFQLQANQPTIWALVDPSRPTISRWFRMIGTGRALLSPSDDITFSSRLKPRYIGTVQDQDGLVLHLFEMCDE